MFGCCGKVGMRIWKFVLIFETKMIETEDSLFTGHIW